MLLCCVCFSFIGLKNLMIFKMLVFSEGKCSMSMLVPSAYTQCWVVKYVRKKLVAVESCLFWSDMVVDTCWLMLGAAVQA